MTHYLVAISRVCWAIRYTNIPPQDEAVRRQLTFNNGVISGNHNIAVDGGGQQRLGFIPCIAILLLINNTSISRGSFSDLCCMLTRWKYLI